MPDGMQRFVQGTLDVGGGISRGLLKKLLIDYEQKQQEIENQRKREQFGLQKVLTGAQADYYTAGAEERRARLAEQDRGKWRPLSNTGYLYNELTGETKRATGEGGELIGFDEPTFTIKDIIKIRQQAEDDARQILNKSRGQDLGLLETLRNESARDKAAEEGRTLKPEELPYPVSPPPTYSDIANLADTLQYQQLGIPTELIGPLGRSPGGIMNLLTTGNIPEQKAETKSEEQSIIEQLKANPALLKTTDWDKAKKDNPDLDWDAIFNAIENM